MRAPGNQTRRMAFREVILVDDLGKATCTQNTDGQKENG